MQSTLLLDVERIIPQEPLPNPERVKTDPLLIEAHNAQKGLGVLETILYHCKKISPSGDACLSEFSKICKVEDKLLVQPVIKDLQLKHICHLYESIEEVSADAIIYTIPQMFREDIPISSIHGSASSAQEPDEQALDDLIEKLCTVIGQKSFEQDSGAPSAGGSRAAAAAGRNLLEPMLKRFLCRYLSVESASFSEMAPLSSYAYLFPVLRGSTLTPEVVAQALPQVLQLRHSFRLWEALMNASFQQQESIGEWEGPSQAPKPKPSRAKPKGTRRGRRGIDA